MAPGGLCGTRTLDGYEFVIGCNDFGAGMTRIMVEFGVPVRFRRRRMRFVFERGTYHVPPTAGTIVQVLKQCVDFVRLARAARLGGRPHHEYVGPLVQDRVLEQRVCRSRQLPVLRRGACAAGLPY